MKRVFVAQFRERRPMSFFRCRATGEQPRIAILHVLREFLDDLGLARRIKIQACQSVFDLVFPLRHVRLLIHPLHSQRNAIIGSTFVARRAGIQQAASATTSSSKAIPTNVSGSVALTPNNKASIKRVKASDTVRPSDTPQSASFKRSEERRVGKECRSGWSPDHRQE